VAAASLTFGSQSDLDVLPGILLSEAYAAALFYSFAFMAGELVRRSSLSYIFVSAVFFSSQIIGFYTSFVYQLTGREFYRTIYLYLPTSPVNSLPLQYATGHLPTQTQALFQFFNGTGLLEPTIELSVLLLGGYIIVAVGVALAYFRYADVSRRVS
jgi:ABC-2 type transport system permease protein